MSEKSTRIILLSCSNNTVKNDISASTFLFHEAFAVRIFATLVYRETSRWYLHICMFTRYQKVIYFRYFFNIKHSITIRSVSNIHGICLYWESNHTSEKILLLVHERFANERRKYFCFFKVLDPCTARDARHPKWIFLDNSALYRFYNRCRRPLKGTPVDGFRLFFVDFSMILQNVRVSNSIWKIIIPEHCKK